MNQEPDRLFDWAFILKRTVIFLNRHIFLGKS